MIEVSVCSNKAECVPISLLKLLLHFIFDPVKNIGIQFDKCISGFMQVLQANFQFQLLGRR